MPDFIHITVEGADELQKALEQFPKETARYLSAAGKESADRVILPTQGLKRYPPATRANQPPTPYYIRGRGTQNKSGNTGSSERLGTRWYTRRTGPDVEIGNISSYAEFVVGDRQAWWHAIIGWKILRNVAIDKIEQIQKVYQSWTDKLLKDLGLK